MGSRMRGCIRCEVCSKWYSQSLQDGHSSEEMNRALEERGGDESQMISQTVQLFMGREMQLLQ